MERALRGGSVGARTTILYRMLVAAGELAALPASERPNCLLAYLHRYLRVFDTSHAAVAERYATAAIAADDHKAAAFVTLAVIYDKAQHPLDSLKAAQKGIAADPGHAPAYDRAAIAASRWSNLLLDYLID